MNNNAVKCLGDNGVCIPLKTYSYEKKKTNADKIREMSDEELARIMVTDPIFTWDKYEDDYDDVLYWLQSEAE